ncbi:hypothetical protein HE1_01091 [Holospora elegans E1]|uniref:Uncharacterized protein n=1 Tax=Holospora elegans E1 TaxID=1427503 RepID=A0A023E0Z1_9PROT|nr:hypothetical protein HE1_01091 [Holospora elegans E1]
MIIPLSSGDGSILAHRLNPKVRPLQNSGGAGTKSCALRFIEKPLAYKTRAWSLSFSGTPREIFPHFLTFVPLTSSNKTAFKAILNIHKIYILTYNHF